MKRRNFLACCIFVWIALAYGCAAARAETELEMDFGVRADDLRWSIPGGFTGKDNKFYQQNIVSELTWKNLKSNYLDVHGVFQDGKLVVRGDVGYGMIDSGDNQDSDYRGNNRTQEFSRSNNKSNGDHVSDVKIGFGLNFDLVKREAGPKLQLTPLVGLSSHVQSLRMTNMTQTVSVSQYAPLTINPPALGSYRGLNSSYEARWRGPWTGIDVLYHVAQKASLHANFEYHKADYSAQANWHLRTDVAHPKSFAHDATGDGYVLQLGVGMTLSDHMRMVFSVTSQEWTTGTGTDHFYFADGSSEYGSLNPVKWRSQAYLLGLQVRL
jgi:hypothetical protein